VYFVRLIGDDRPEIQFIELGQVRGTATVAEPVPVEGEDGAYSTACDSFVVAETEMIADRRVGGALGPCDEDVDLLLAEEAHAEARLQTCEMDAHEWIRRGFAEQSPHKKS
jgi:hypothetical protein